MLGTTIWPRSGRFPSIGKGSAALDGYREAELLRHEGKGCLTHMWFGGDWPGYERTRLRIYVDGEPTPSIDMKLGLGHGYGFGEASVPWGGERLGKTGHPSGVYNTYRIPFGRSVRVTAQRDKKSPEKSAFWWIVRGTENLPVMIGGVRLPRDARRKSTGWRTTPPGRWRSSTSDGSKHGKTVGDPPETEYTTYTWVYEWPSAAGPPAQAR